MALEKKIVQAALKVRGLTENNADFMTFETEDVMNTALDSMIPKTYKSIDDLMADPAFNKSIRTYGDKRVTDAKDKWEKDGKGGAGGGSGNNETTPDIAKIVEQAVQAAVKPFTDKVTQLETEKQTEARSQKIKGLLQKEFPVEVHELVMAKIPTDADDTKIAAIIGETKATFTALGLKNIGEVGQGGGGGNATAKSEIDSWGAKRAKKTEQTVKK